MNTSKEHHEEADALLDQLSSSVDEAKECFRLKKYEDAAGYLDEARSELKRVAALINEIQVAAMAICFATECDYDRDPNLKQAS